MRFDVVMDTWRAIVPIRGLQDAKSRFLDLPLPGATLAWAMFTDLLNSLNRAACIHEITVVTSINPEEFQERFPGVACVQEPPGVGLNHAIGIAGAQQLPASTKGTMVFLGDLPCIRPDDIDHLSAVGIDQPSFVPDAAGSGTTIWCAPKTYPVKTHFGRHSRAAHRASGGTELGNGFTADPWPRLRRDVDTQVDLWDAHRIGLGPVTLATVAPYFPVKED
ncbi:MAG: 2-phospho-L-lactate guanylyltransferase [Actinomycetota bacterium]